MVAVKGLEAGRVMTVTARRDRVVRKAKVGRKVNKRSVRQMV